MKKEEYLLQIIRSPWLTEKASILTGSKQLVFKVDTKATKTEIKEAVESLIGVDVISVRTVNTVGKVKRFANRTGRRSSYKKAYISLDKSVDMEALLARES